MLINTIFNLQAVFFWPCDEKKETETFLRTGLILKKRQQGKEAREDVAWIKKAAKCKMSDRCTNSIKVQRCAEGHDCLQFYNIFKAGKFKGLKSHIVKKKP